jgi:hypothetical protein
MLRTMSSRVKGFWLANPQCCRRKVRPSILAKIRGYGSLLASASNRAMIFRGGGGGAGWGKDIGGGQSKPMMMMRPNASLEVAAGRRRPGEGGEGGLFSTTTSSHDFGGEGGGGGPMTAATKAVAVRSAASSPEMRRGGAGGEGRGVRGSVWDQASELTREVSIHVEGEGEGESGGSLSSPPTTTAAGADPSGGGTSGRGGPSGLLLAGREGEVEASPTSMVAKRLVQLHLADEDERESLSSALKRAALIKRLERELAKTPGGKGMVKKKLGQALIGAGGAVAAAGGAGGTAGSAPGVGGGGAGAGAGAAALLGIVAGSFRSADDATTVMSKATFRELLKQEVEVSLASAASRNKSRSTKLGQVSQLGQSGLWRRFF